MSLIPSAQINSLSNQQYKEVIGNSKLSNNQQQVMMVRNVGQRISKAVERYLKENGYEDLIDEFNWEFNLIEEATVNAWCMPGGKVAFYTGILPICQDENGVAVVMGHEIAHAIAKHGNERMTQALAQQAGGLALSVALRQQPEQTKNLYMAAYGATTSLGVILPFSRKHESEADRLGLKFMAMAGYDPREAPKFWQRMQSLKSSSSTTSTAQKATKTGVNAKGQATFSMAPQKAADNNTSNAKAKEPMASSLDLEAFTSTHPSHSKRITDLNKWMPEAMKFYQQNK